MPGIQQMEVDIFQVMLVRIGTLGWKNVIVFSPDDQGRWLVLAKVGLPRWIVRDVILVVVKQGELYLRITCTRQMSQIDIPVVGADNCLVPDPVGVLPLHTVR